MVFVIPPSDIADGISFDPGDFHENKPADRSYIIESPMEWPVFNKLKSIDTGRSLLSIGATRILAAASGPVGTNWLKENLTLKAPRFTGTFTTASVVVILCLAAKAAVVGQESGKGADRKQAPASAPTIYVPDTISPWAQQILRRMKGPQGLPLPGPDDLEGWKKIRNYTPPQLKEIFSETNERVQERYHPTTLTRTLGGVPVVEIRPPKWADDGKLLVYVHGGGYVTGGPAFSLGGWVAEESGMRIVSVGYTLAPESRWDHTTDQVIAVFEALRREGYALKNMAIFGDSAGGGLAAGSVLKMRDKGLGMPAAVILWSPWADITETGDTYVTLKQADPILDYSLLLKKAADAYADPEDQKTPYVSPVYGDYSKGFPPALIQGGTKEIFLSDFVRLYRAIDSAGGTAVLDIYEGMPHVFQAVMFGSPESEQAMKKMKAFLATYLGK
jgi:epsilon-lactone hydrolase